MGRALLRLSHMQKGTYYIQIGDNMSYYMEELLTKNDTLR